MNELKRFDRYQILIGIIAASCFLLSIIMFIIMVFTADVVIEEGKIQTITYNFVLQNIYTFFTLAHILAAIWFIARLITFKLRKKEYELI